MKTNILTLIFLAMFIGSPIAYSQTVNNGQTPYIGQTAPSFKGQSTTGMINFPDDYFNKWKILFSHPADFTPVCTSEIMALAAKQEEFKKLNTALVVISTDGLNSHIEWVKSIESISAPGNYSVKINFPLVADVSYEVSKKYNLLRKDSVERKDLRSVVFIDTDNKIRAILTYPDNIGRNIDEILRILVALQTADKNNVLTPANWKTGDDVLIRAPKSIEESDKLKEKSKPGYYNYTWYMWFRKL
jgi:peroxiredoxin 2/4